MSKPFFFVVAAGVAVGLAWPTSKPTVEAAAAAASGSQETVLERERNGHFYATAKINGELIRFLVDTGASYVALTEADADRLRIPYSRSDFTYVGEGASGPVHGQIITIEVIELDGKKVENVQGAILQGSDLSLLGQSFLSRVGEVYMHGETMVIR